MELKTLKDLEGCDENGIEIDYSELKEIVIKLFKNFQSSNTIYPLILEKFPDRYKGECAKDRWNNTEFRYGTEYGMLSLLWHLFNLTEKDLK